MEDVTVLDTPSTAANHITLTDTNIQNIGFAYIGNAEKDWSISDVVLTVNDTFSIKAKLSSVAKGAFKGCKKKIKVSGTSKKQNVKKLKKSGYKKFK